VRLNMPMENPPVISVQCRKCNVRKSGPQQRDDVKSRFALPVAEQLAHHALRSVSTRSAPEFACCDDAKPVLLEAIGQSEQRQVPASTPDTVLLNFQELRTPSKTFVAR